MREFVEIFHGINKTAFAFSFTGFALVSGQHCQYTQVGQICLTFACKMELSTCFSVKGSDLSSFKSD